MELIFSRKAFRQLCRLERKVQQRINGKLNFYLSQKEPLAFAERIMDSRFGEWRFRIGDYRVLFDVNRDTIEVLKVDHRGDIYK